MNKEILEAEVAEGVTVQDVINAFQSALDGTNDHDLKGMTGLSDEGIDQLIKVRNATTKFWQF